MQVFSDRNRVQRRVFGLLDAFDVRDIMVRKLAGARERLLEMRDVVDANAVNGEAVDLERFAVVLVGGQLDRAERLAVMGQLAARMTDAGLSQPGMAETPGSD